MAGAAIRSDGARPDPYPGHGGERPRVAPRVIPRGGIASGTAGPRSSRTADDYERLRTNTGRTLRRQVTRSPGYHFAAAPRASLCLVDVDTSVNYCGQTQTGYRSAMKAALAIVAACGLVAEPNQATCADALARPPPQGQPIAVDMSYTDAAHRVLRVDGGRSLRARQRSLRLRRRDQLSDSGVKTGLSRL
jgi:hypothetical protein